MQSESNPNSHSQGPTKDVSGSKEGLSVYGLFHRLARTPQGKSILRQYFLKPSLSIDVINERLETASVFLRPDNTIPLQKLIKSLRSVKNMRTVMIHLRKGVDNGSAAGAMKSGIWSSLRSFAFHALQIIDAIAEVIGSDTIAIGIKILNHFDTRVLGYVGTQISDIVDFTTSGEMHRTVVRPGVDAELDHMKHTYDGIENMLNETSRAIAATVPPQHSLNLNVIFFPQIGFLICMPVNSDTGKADYEGNNEELERWDMVFHTETRCYYKDYRMRELDATFGDMYGSICGPHQRPRGICL